MSKKFKTFCRIIDYVESVDTELAELLRGTCADMSLGSLKGKPGITFLMPQDKAFRKKIADLAYSDKIEDANKACDMLNACIFRDVFKTPSDWMNKRDDIPNALLPSQHVEVENVSGKEVIFKSGAKAVVDDGFKDASKKSNLAVWKLVSGELPVTTDKPAKLKYAKKKGGKGGKSGGYDAPGQDVQNIRFKIAVAVENMYMMDQLNKSMGSAIVGAHETGGFGPAVPYTQRRRDVYLEYTMSLVNYLMNVSYDEHLLYGKVLPMISFQKIDFYNLVQPHTFRGEDAYLIPTGIIISWWTSQSTSFNLQNVIDQVSQKLSNAPTTWRSAKVYSDRRAVLHAADEKRQQINQLVGNRSRSMPDMIIDAYKELNENNAIGGLSDIFPQPLADFYKAEPGLKVMQDELRYLTFLQFEALERNPDFDHGHFETIINMIAEYQHAVTSDERERTLKLNNKYTMKYLIQPTEKIQEIRVFVNSTHFMYIPLSSADVMDFPLKNVITKPDPTDLQGIWNIDRGTISRHKRLAQPGQEQASLQSVLSQLRGVDPASVDPKVKALLLEVSSKFVSN